MEKIIFGLENSIWWIWQEVNVKLKLVLRYVATIYMQMFTIWAVLY